MLRCNRPAQRFVFALALMAAGGVAVHADPTLNRDPEAARIVTEDIDRFWEAHDAAREAHTPEAKAEAYRTGYIEPGSAGLKEFVRLRIGDADQLSAVVERHPRYFQALRRHSGTLGRHEAPIRAAMRTLAARYPDAVFPDVYLLVGRMSSGGTLSETGLLIGVEMYGRAGDTPLDELGDWHRAVIGPMHALPHIVAHELVHYQQRYAAEGGQTLLAAAVREGTADFVAELISGRHINHHVHEWADPRVAQLWAEFEPVMHGTDFGTWLYDTAPGDGRPADLGYWIGYRIARAYYERADDKDVALREMLQISDYDAFVARSGFARSLSAAAP